MHLRPLAMVITTAAAAAAAAAMTIGTASAGAAVGAKTPGASVATAAPTTRGRDVSRVARRDEAALPAPVTVRTVSDGSFSVARTVVSVRGERHVVFTARNLHTGEECVLNGTT